MTTIKTNTIAIESAKAKMAELLKNEVSESKGLFGAVAMSALKTIAKKAFGQLPIFRTRYYDNSVETFQNFFNEFSEVNGLMVTVPTHGVWCERTQAAFDLIVKNFNK